MLERLKRLLRRAAPSAPIPTEAWVVLELNGGEPYFITWTPHKAEALAHYRRLCDAVDIPYDDPHNVEVDVHLFHGKPGENLAEYFYRNGDS